MNAMNQIAEARATALSLRASAKACSTEQGALKFRLTRAAESLDAVVLLAVRGLDRIEQLEQRAFTPTALEVMRGALAALEGKPCQQQAIDDQRVTIVAEDQRRAQRARQRLSNSLLIVSNNFDADDIALLDVALDLLEQRTREELTATATDWIKHSAAIATCSRLLIVRGKLRLLQASRGQGGAP